MTRKVANLGDPLKNFLTGIVCVALAALAPASLKAEGMTDAERKVVVDYLVKTRAMYFEALKGLTEAQWNFKSAPDRWSIFECAEHIANVEDQIFSGIQQLVRTPPDDAKAATMAARRAQMDMVVSKMVPDRKSKVSSPEEVKPTGRYATPKELLAHYTESREQTLKFANTSKDDLRVHFIKHFALGDLDLYQWLLMIPAHNERHMKQIAEVMADPAYPKPAGGADR